IEDKWYCSEIIAPQSLGYGEYSFKVSTNLENLDKNIVLGLFTHETDTKEIDLEFSRWGNSSSPVGWYIIQPPSSERRNHFPLNLTGSYSTHKFEWNKEEVFFQSFHGHGTNNLIKEWKYTGVNIPPEGNEKVILNFWLNNGQPPSDGNEAEVIIKSFKFKPIEPTISILVPKGGEEWEIGKTQEIKWESKNHTGNVTIEVNENYPNGDWKTIIEDTEDDGSFIFFVNGTPGEEKRVSVKSVNIPIIGGISDANFSYTPSSSKEPQTMMDIDGNIYSTVTIGSQIWMGQNLKTTKYNDDTPIPLVTDGTTWGSLNSPAYCWYDNNISFKNPYGALYNWHVLDADKLCPTGWHIPTYDEWNILTDFLGGIEIAGGKMKEVGTNHWLPPNVGATNSSGFKALPGGGRDSFGSFLLFGTSGFWWSLTETISTDAWIRDLSTDFGSVGWASNFNKKYGYSVRCLRDYPVSSKMISTNDFIKIYPNPANEEIFIECSNLNIFNCDIDILNVEGRIVKQWRNINLISRQTLSIKELVSGIYIVSIKTEDIKVNRRIIKRDK
ncbi:FISUMP domain-containing protein, partial [Bacteroidota bacterium]